MPRLLSSAGVPVAGGLVRGGAGHRQRLLVETQLVLGRCHERDHVQRVDVQRLEPVFARGPGRRLEVRPGRVGVTGRAEQPAALERGPGRHLGVPDGQAVEDGVPLVVPLLQPERPRHLGQEHQPVGALGGLGRCAEPLLGAGRVVEVPKGCHVRHGDHRAPDVQAWGKSAPVYCASARPAPSSCRSCRGRPPRRRRAGRTAPAGTPRPWRSRSSKVFRQSSTAMPSPFMLPSSSARLMAVDHARARAAVPASVRWTWSSGWLGWLTVHQR